MRGIAIAISAICLCTTAATAYAPMPAAAPLIIADSVSSTCRIESNGSVSTVSVKLNATTHSHYGATLKYHFRLASGGPWLPAIASPAGGANPVLLAVPTGSYKLVIAPVTTLTPNSTQSPEYTVSVPANVVTTIGSRKLCAKSKESTNPRPRPAVRR